MNVNTQIFYDINDFARQTPWLHPILAGYADYGVVVFAVLMLLGWWSARKAVDEAAMVAAVWTPLGVVAAALVYDPIAFAVNETRPCNALHDIVVLHCNTDGGFPSIHAVIAAAVTAGTWLVNRKLGLLALAAAAVMAFARVYIGAHYPLDVLAGLALGAVVSVVGYVLAKPVLRRVLALVARTRLRVLITTAPVDRH